MVAVTRHSRTIKCSLVPSGCPLSRWGQDSLGLTLWGSLCTPPTAGSGLTEYLASSYRGTGGLAVDSRCRCWALDRFNQHCTLVCMPGRMCQRGLLAVSQPARAQFSTDAVTKSELSPSSISVSLFLRFGATVFQPLILLSTGY